MSLHQVFSPKTNKKKLYLAIYAAGFFALVFTATGVSNAVFGSPRTDPNPARSGEPVLLVEKKVRNISQGSSFDYQTDALPEDIVEFSIRVRAEFGTVDGVWVRDEMDRDLLFFDEVRMSGSVVSSVNFFGSGLNAGSIDRVGKTINYRAQVERAEEFRVGVTPQPNKVIATNIPPGQSRGGQLTTSTATVNVERSAGGPGGGNPISCPLPGGSNRIIIGLSRQVLLSGHSEEITGISIPKGKYDVTLVSWDDHSENPPQHQPNESFYLRAMNGAFRTNAIGDLADNQQSRTQVVNQNMNVSQNVSGIRIVHNSNDTSNPNSIYPICAAFDRIQTPPPPAPSCDLSVQPRSIQRGQSAVLSWSSSNTSGGSINNGIGNVPESGNRTVSPTRTTTYTGTFVGPGGSVNCSTTLTVVNTPPPPLPQCSLTVFPNSINRGQSATLNWTSQDTTRVFINNGIGNVAVNGSRTVSPIQTTTYTGTFSGPGGSVNCSATLTVVDTPPPPPEPPSCTLSAFPSIINRGQNATLFWSSQNAVSATLNTFNGNIGTVPVNGSQIVSPTQTTIYVLVVVGGDGSAFACQTTLQVVGTPPPPGGEPSCTIGIFPNSIRQGQNATLFWSSQNAVSASISAGVGSVAATGNISVSPTQSTIYIMDVVGTNGSTASCQATLTVTDTPPPPGGQPSCTVGIFPSSIRRGQSATLFWRSQNVASATITAGVGSVAPAGSISVSPSDSTIYIMDVTGADGSTASCQATLTVTDTPPPPGGQPSCSMDLFPSFIQRGQSATLFWSSQNASSASINNGIGNVSLNGSRSVSPFQTTTYTGTFAGAGGSVSCSTTLSVDSFQSGQLFINKQVQNITRGGSGFAESVSANPGDRVRFEIRVSTSGNTTQNSVFVRDSLPSQLSFVSGSLRVDNSSFSPESSLFGSGIGLGNLFSGSSRVVSFEATVNSSISATTVTNIAYARSNQTSEIQDSAQVTTSQVAGVRTGQSKSAFNLTRGVNATTVPANPGDVITYTLVFRNTGSTTLQGVVIEDNINDILELADLVNLGDAREVTGGVIRWSPVDIAPGGQATRSFQVKVKPAEQIPANSDLLMVNIYGNEVRVPVSIVRGTTIVPPRTGAGEWVAAVLAGLSTAGYWFYQRKKKMGERGVEQTKQIV